MTENNIFYLYILPMIACFICISIGTYSDWSAGEDVDMAEIAKAIFLPLLPVFNIVFVVLYACYAIDELRVKMRKKVVFKGKRNRDF